MGIKTGILFFPTGVRVDMTALIVMDMIMVSLNYMYL